MAGDFVIPARLNRKRISCTKFSYLVLGRSGSKNWNIGGNAEYIGRVEIHTGYDGRPHNRSKYHEYITK